MHVCVCVCVCLCICMCLSVCVVSFDWCSVPVEVARPGGVLLPPFGERGDTTGLANSQPSGEVCLYFMQNETLRLISLFQGVVGMWCARRNYYISPFSSFSSPLLSLAQVSPLHTARLFRRILSSVHKSWKTAKRGAFPQFDHVRTQPLMCVL